MRSVPKRHVNGNLRRKDSEWRDEVGKGGGVVVILVGNGDFLVKVVGPISDLVTLEPFKIFWAGFLK